MMCAQVESSSYSSRLIAQGFMKIWIWCLWTQTPMLKLANCNELHSLIFPCCSHDSQWNSSLARSLFFTPPILNLKFVLF
jgi:hypothetical protein